MHFININPVYFYVNLAKEEKQCYNMREVRGLNEIRSAYFSRDSHKKHTHYHDSHQIILIVKGEVKAWVNEKSFTAKSGNLLIFSRLENHSIEAVSDNYERYVIRLNPVSDRLYSILSNRPDGFTNIIDTGDRLDEFEAIFKKICEEKNVVSPFSEDMLESLSRVLMVMLHRITPSSIYNELVSDIQKKFETDFSGTYTLEALACEYSVSVSKLSHEFKKVTGSSVMEYLTFCRIAAAKNMLIKTDSDISKIVEKCGFSDASNFSRTFKKHTGLSPTGFRRKYIGI